MWLRIDPLLESPFLHSGKPGAPPAKDLECQPPAEPLNLKAAGHPEELFMDRRNGLKKEDE